MSNQQHECAARTSVVGCTRGYCCFRDPQVYLNFLSEKAPEKLVLVLGLPGIHGLTRVTSADEESSHQTMSVATAVPEQTNDQRGKRLRSAHIIRLP
jgi:hypothetical protein